MRAVRQGRPSLNEHSVLPGSAPASSLHLARELVHADVMVAKTSAEFMWDQAEEWLAYRERVFVWRFLAQRGRRPNHLQVCPYCGHVERLEPGSIRCQACDEWWTGDNP